MKYVSIILILLLTSCEGPNNGVQSPSGQSGGSSVASSLAGGMAAGVGMAAGHHIINGAVNKWQERKSARSYGGGFNRMSRGFGGGRR